MINRLLIPDEHSVNSNKIKCNSLSGFRILHANVRSIFKNFDKLELLLKQIETTPELIAISETKLKNHIQYKPNINEFDFVYNNLIIKAEGVGVFIKSHFLYKVV